jgi:3-oxo-5-alpha-steroid 4-dehydrogenase 3
LTYGARALSTPALENNSAAATDYRDGIARFLDFVASITVPHSWFIHFYVFAGLLTTFCAYEISTQHLGLFEVVTQSVNVQGEAMTKTQTLVVSGLFLFHVYRRFVEQICAPKSSSRMSFLHWIMGLLFYLFMSVAIWIEGSASEIEISPFGKGWSPGFQDNRCALAF